MPSKKLKTHDVLRTSEDWRGFFTAPIKTEYQILQKWETEKSWYFEKRVTLFENIGKEMIGVGYHNPVTRSRATFNRERTQAKIVVKLIGGQKIKERQK